jgi:mannosylglycerate hydrolase
MLKYIIIHQHWDPAWISQRKHTEPQLKMLFEDIIDKMKKYPSYKFVLDGQTHIIEDYLKQLPKEEFFKKKEELSKYVKEGRLIVGPFYSQVDWNLSSGELLIRNLLIGHFQSKELGRVNKCGWVIDVFGFPSATIRILKGFEIDSIYLSRGIGIDKKYVKEAYWWEENKEKILCVHLIESYRNLMELAKTKNFFEERINNKAKILSQYSVTKKAVLLFDGYENLPSCDDIIPLIRKMKDVFITTPEEYKNLILNSNPKLYKISGYLNSGKYIASLSGVFSNRIYLKKKQYFCEEILERYLEPFGTLLYLFGDKYPKNFLRNLWKCLIKISSHDEICGCSTDEVHRDALIVYNRIEKLAKFKLNKILKKIAQNINTNFSKRAISLIVFNPTPYKNTEILSLKIKLPENLSKGFYLVDENNNILPVEIGRRKGKKFEIYFEARELPPLGYKTYKILKGEKEIKSNLKISEFEKTMENDYLKVKINENGTLDVFDKINKFLYKNLSYLKDEGDRGDLYTASIIKDKFITNLDCKAKISLVEKNKFLATFRIEQILKLPKCLDENREKRSEELVDFPVVSYVTLNFNSPRIDFLTKVYNLVSDHRLRVCFPTGIKSSYHYIDHKFDISKFPNKVEKKFYCGRENSLKGILTPAYDIIPPEGFSHNSFIDLSDGKRGICIISCALPEYKISPDNTIELTLLRCVGWLGLDDLIGVRYGRAGWKIFTPDAQCLGRHIFSYSILFHSGDLGKEELQKEAIKKNTKLLTIKTNSYSGKFPASFQILEIESQPEDSLIISAVKIAEEGKNLIIRFYNVLNKRVSYSLKFPFKIKKAFLTDLEEKEKKEILIKGNKISGEVAEKEIVTLKIEIERKNLKLLNPTKDLEILKAKSYEDKNERFDKIKIQSLITEDILKKEKERVKETTKLVNLAKEELKNIKSKYKNSKFKVDILKIEKQKMKLFEFIEMQQDAIYSFLLTQKRYFEEKKDKRKLEIVQNKIDKMAQNLILPRAKRQLQQFVIDYLEKLV